MPSVDSNSSYSSSDSSTSPLSSPRALLADIMQHQQHTAPAISSSSYFHHQHRPMKSNSPSSPAIIPSHSCVTRYKTELCRPFTETGKCKYGDKCQFSHGMKELRVLSRHPKYKTEYCRTFHTTGYCPYGPRCHFIHDVHETRATSSSSNANDFSMRRHSDLRTYSSAPKSTSRNRINSDYTTSTSSSSSSQSKTTANATAFPFSFEELSEALLSYETDEIFSPQYPQAPQQVQQPQQQHRQEDFYPSRLSAMTDLLTYRAFSSSSSSNSSLAPQYI